MKKTGGILLFAIFLAPVLVTAQNGTTRVEVFGGYSFLHTPRGETTFNGWNAAATVNLNNWFGATPGLGHRPWNRGECLGSSAPEIVQKAMGWESSLLRVSGQIYGGARIGFLSEGLFGSQLQSSSLLV